MSDTLKAALKKFASDNQFGGKGLLSVALVVTDHAQKQGLPLNANAQLTKGGAQVKGAGGGAVKRILAKYGIDRRLASEGGRTSRGTPEKMKAYVAFLNKWHERGALDLNEVQEFWIDEVRAFFAGQPFKLKLDSSKSLRVTVRDLIAQAEERQKESPHTNYAGTLLQHLVGAKLDCALGMGAIEHNSSSTADAPSGRPGDFVVGEAAIHVTTSPSEALIEKCRNNLNAGLRPILVTLQKGLLVAEGLAENAGIAGRFDAFEIEQFLALNLYEQGKFGTKVRQTAVAGLVNRYNEIITEVETDPSLKIDLT